MKKNVASQVVGCQMNSATDGSAFSGTVTVYVTGDAGTQALGSVGSGVCTHEGNGFHTYAPAQAETNYDHVAFTFIGSGAIPSTVQIYTSFPQTGDSYARIGAPAGASASADIAAIKAVLPSALGANGNIKADVRDFNGTAGTFASGRPEVNTTHAAGTAWNSGAIGAATLAADTITDAKVASDVTIASVTGAVGSVTGNVGGNVTGSVGSVVGAVGSVTGLTASDVSAIKAKTDNLPSDPADQSLIIAATNSILSDTNAIKGTTDKLDDTLEDDAGTYRFTSNALEEAPSGTGASAATIAAAVWSEGARTLTAIDEDSTTLDLDATIRAAVGMASANLDTQLDALPTATDNADALLNRDMSAVSDTNARSPLNALRHIRNKWSLSGTTLTVTKEDDSTTAWTATMTTNASADPITGSDPA